MLGCSNSRTPYGNVHSTVTVTLLSSIIFWEGLSLGRAISNCRLPKMAQHQGCTELQRCNGDSKPSLTLSLVMNRSQDRLRLNYHNYLQVFQKTTKKTSSSLMHENQQEVQKVWFWEPIQKTGCDFMPTTHWRFCHAKSHLHFFFFKSTLLIQTAESMTF